MHSSRRLTTVTGLSVLLALVLVGVWPMEGLAKTTGESAKTTGESAKTTGESAKTTGGHKSTRSSSATISKPKAPFDPGSPKVDTATPGPVRLLDGGMRAGGASSLLK
jgi:hypothetical protein